MAGCSFGGWAGVGGGVARGTGEAGAAGSLSSLALRLLWFLSSGPAALGVSFTSSFLRTRPLGEAMVPRGEGGFGGRAWPDPGLGQGEAGLCQGVEGEAGRALDLALQERQRGLGGEGAASECALPLGAQPNSGACSSEVWVPPPTLHSPCAMRDF